VIDDTFLILFNAWEGAVDFTLPAVSFGRRWELELTSVNPAAEAGSESYRARAVVSVDGRSLVLLRRVG
jgi:isoamylase